MSPSSSHALHGEAIARWYVTVSSVGASALRRPTEYWDWAVTKPRGRGCQTRRAMARQGRDKLSGWDEVYEPSAAVGWTKECRLPGGKRLDGKHRIRHRFRKPDGLPESMTINAICPFHPGDSFLPPTEPSLVHFNPARECLSRPGGPSHAGVCAGPRQAVSERLPGSPSTRGRPRALAPTLLTGDVPHRAKPDRQGRASSGETNGTCQNRCFGGRMDHTRSKCSLDHARSLPQFGQRNPFWPTVGAPGNPGNAPQCCTASRIRLTDAGNHSDWSRILLIGVT